MKGNLKKFNMKKRIVALIMTMVMAFGAFSPVIALADETPAPTPTNTTAKVTLNGKDLDLTNNASELNGLGLKAGDIEFSVANTTTDKRFQTKNNLVINKSYTITVGEGYTIKTISGTYDRYFTQNNKLNINNNKFTVPLSVKAIKLNIELETTNLVKNSNAKILVDSGTEGQNVPGLEIKPATVGAFNETDKNFSLNELKKDTSYTVSLENPNYTVDSIEVMQGNTPITHTGLSFRTSANSTDAVHVIVKVNTTALVKNSTAKILVDSGTEGQNITGLKITNATIGTFNETNKNFPLNGLEKNASYTVSLENPLYEIDSIEVKQGTETITPDGLNFKTNENSTNAIVLEVKISSIQSNVVRVSGNDRYLTALKIANESYGNKVDTIVIANGSDKASVDALAVGPLANELHAPILLVDSSIKTEVLDYIKNSGVKKLYIAGGTNSVSKAIVDSIISEAKLNNSDVKRLSGDNRYITSQKIAEELINKHSYKKIVILAHGTTTVDALAASTYATQEKYPIILSDSVALDGNVKSALKTLDVAKIIPVGGVNTLPDSVITNANFTLGDRIAGNNREETSVAIAKKLNVKNSVIIANGYKGSVDALAAAGLANVKKAPILLTGTALTQTQQTVISAANDAKRYTGYVVGGTNSVSADILNAVNVLITALPK